MGEMGVDERMASVWYRSRALAGKSQEYMALEMGIARKTVQNWEKGVSAPSVMQAIEWFRVLDVSPLPYLFEYIYPDLEKLSATDEDKRLKQALFKLLESLPVEGIRQILYLFYGDHGSSPRAVMHLVNAHLQTPMKDRIAHGELILKNYELAKRKGKLTGAEHIKPDEALLREAIRRGEEAYLADKEAYIINGEYDRQE